MRLAALRVEAAQRLLSCHLEEKEEVSAGRNLVQLAEVQAELLVRLCTAALLLNAPNAAAARTNAGCRTRAGEAF